MSIKNIILNKLQKKKASPAVDHEALQKDRIEKQRAMRAKHKAKPPALPQATALQPNETQKPEAMSDLEWVIYKQALAGDFQ